MAIARNLLQRVGGRAGTAAPQGAVCELPNPLFRSTSFSYPSTWLKFRGSCEHRRFGVAGCWATSASVVCKSIEAGEWRKGMKPDAAALPRSAALVRELDEGFFSTTLPRLYGRPRRFCTARNPDELFSKCRSSAYTPRISFTSTVIAS
jgi:hypothetical protein